ncbi:MAG: hypothetical protein K0U13_06260 [Chlamydiae bacterium]|nr:hypothetical protein [Chlamydiota bacterium]
MTEKVSDGEESVGHRKIPKRELPSSASSIDEYMNRLEGVKKGKIELQFMVEGDREQSQKDRFRQIYLYDTTPVDSDSFYRDVDESLLALANQNFTSVMRKHLMKVFAMGDGVDREFDIANGEGLVIHFLPHSTELELIWLGALVQCTEDGMKRIRNVEARMRIKPGFISTRLSWELKSPTEIGAPRSYQSLWLRENSATMSSNVLEPKA